MAGIASLTIAYLLSQFFRTFLAVLTPALSSEIGATKADLSAASGAFFLAFALSQFPIGVALDRIGPRLTASTLLAGGAGLGTLAFALASQPWMIVAAMALIGIGCAPVLMASLYIFARLYPAARFAMLASWTVALGTAGNVIGAAPLALAAAEFGWRPVMGALGVVSVAIAGVVAALVRDPPKPAADAMQQGGYGELLSLRVLWALIPLTTVAYAASVSIRGLWVGPFLTDVHGAGSLEIGNVTLVMALSMAAGAFVYGPLDQIFGTRKWVAVVGTAICIACLVFLGLFPRSSVVAVTVALAVLGLSGGTYGLLMAHARAFFPPYLIGRGVTLMNFFAIGGAGLMQFVTGAVVTASIVPGDPVAAYAALFLFVAAVLAVGWLIYLVSRDAPPKA